MLSKKIRLPAAMLMLVAIGLLGETAPTLGQDEGPEVGRFKTADGLKLAYQWYAGGKAQKSDCVLFVHNYGSDMTKGPWAALALSLQKQNYSVLSFDLRGHGKNTDNAAMDKPDEFCKKENAFNRHAGSGMNPKAIKEIKQTKFLPAYYPYLVNDLLGARRFLDEKNDASQCNSGRIFIIAEQSICPMVMLWIATEHKRFGVGPGTRGAFDEVEKYAAGNDIAGVIFLSWAGPPGPGGASALAVAARIMREKEVYSETVLVGDQIKKKIAMAFIYGKDDKGSAFEARNWFTKFGIPAAKTDDSELRKYIREVAGAEKLTGIKLLDILEKPKDKDEKVSALESQIISFFKKTREKDLSGINWKKRNPDNWDPVTIPLDMWGLAK